MSVTDMLPEQTASPVLPCRQHAVTCGLALRRTRRTLSRTGAETGPRRPLPCGMRTAGGFRDWPGFV